MVFASRGWATSPLRQVPRNEEGFGRFCLSLRPFGPITLCAGVAETAGIIHAAMLLGNDVLDLERNPAGVFSTKVAIFAATVCPLPDEGSKRSIHHSPRLSARSWRARDLRMARKVSK